MRVYAEEDWCAEVEVLKDESDAKWEKFTLKVISTIRESLRYKPTPNGTVFDVSQRRGVAFGGMWKLRTIGDDT